MDATVLAVAGLRRLGLRPGGANIIPVDQMLPAVAQGAIGIEARIDDEEILRLLQPLNHEPTAYQVRAERSFLAALDGADRFLEISVKQNAGDAFTILTPRQKILSAPYAVKSKSSETATTANNANQLDGLPSNSFVQLDVNGDVSIGTTSTGSKLTVAGVIESTTGGIKFPDSTVQTTAGLTAVSTNATLTGDGTSQNPLGITSPLLVRDTDNPAFQPFRASTTATGVFVTVPEGKILVIEFIAGYQVIPSVPGAGLELLIPSANTFYYIAPQNISIVAGNYWNNYSQQTRIYLTAGQQLRVNFYTTASSRYISVSGYYVNAPK